VIAELEGVLDGQGLRIGIVVARFNLFVTSRLLAGAKASLTRNGVRESDVTVAWVPGSFELPVVAKKMAASGRFDAVVCLGAVIRGGTDHYQHVSEAAARGISRVALDTGVPVIFGVLTTDTAEQAVERAGGESGEGVAGARTEGKGLPGSEATATEHGNAGYNAGDAAVETANLLRRLES
jgi:6,7-dimethyl-8-ribityllumazine synthase